VHYSYPPFLGSTTWLLMVAFLIPVSLAMLLASLIARMLPH
jgi:hypothetical protein